MELTLVTVFGGSGYFGRAIVDALGAEGCRVRLAVRHPDAAAVGDIRRRWPAAEAVRADILDAPSVAAALEGSRGVVNAVALYAETPNLRFETVHVDGAGRLARLAAEGGVERLVQISGIGSDPDDADPYIRARARGERAVKAAFPAATVVRPGPLAGPGDALVSGLADLVRRSPVVPLFGDGSTRVQPIRREDAGRAVANALLRDDAAGRTYEIAGPEVVSYRALIERIEAALGRNRLKLPIPFALWHLAARLMAPLPSPPLTPGMVALVSRDIVASPHRPGLAELGIEGQGLEPLIAALARRG